MARGQRRLVRGHLEGPYDWSAPEEVTLVRGGLPYLQAVWSDRNVDPLRRDGPAASHLTAQRGLLLVVPFPLTVSVPEPGEYVVRVHWSRYMSASSGCMRPTEDGWSMLVVEQSGTVTIEGSLAPRHC